MRLKKSKYRCHRRILSRTKGGQQTDLRDPVKPCGSSPFTNQPPARPHSGFICGLYVQT